MLLEKSNIMDNLEILGVSSKERAILEAIFKVELINATDLAKSTNTKRGSIYLYLENLKQQRLIIEVEKADKSYTAASVQGSLVRLSSQR
ncbi:hypothetical protein HYW46_01450 [Candidatus Daviesbacteria bacterium]|nr:hypothetical protein [Candidatus Daviesbacteria bacterium]